MRASSSTPWSLFTPSRSLVVAVALASLLGCVTETQERPSHVPSDSRAHEDRAERAPLPLPDTAVRDETAPGPSACDLCDEPREPYDRRSRTVPSRFETRRIGGDDRASERRFHGSPVDLDLKNADLQNVFRLLADVGKVNIVVAGEISGTVTLRLKHVPWDQALDVIVRAKGLDAELDENRVILVRAHAPSPEPK